MLMGGLGGPARHKPMHTSSATKDIFGIAAVRCYDYDSFARIKMLVRRLVFIVLASVEIGRKITWSARTPVVFRGLGRGGLGVWGLGQRLERLTAFMAQ